MRGAASEICRLWMNVIKYVRAGLHLTPRWCCGRASPGDYSGAALRVPPTAGGCVVFVGLVSARVVCRSVEAMSSYLIYLLQLLKAFQTVSPRCTMR